TKEIDLFCAFCASCGSFPFLWFLPHRFVQNSERDRLILDVFRDTAQCCLGCVDVPCCVNRYAFAHGPLGRIRLVMWNEDRDLAGAEASDADTFQPTWVDPFGRLGVGSVNDIVLVDGEPTDTAEVVVLTDKLSILCQDLDAIVMAIGDDQL